MLVYKAAYQFVDGGWAHAHAHAHAIDFPRGDHLRPGLGRGRLLASALLDLGDLCLERGEPLPRPDPSLSDPGADIEEPLSVAMDRGGPFRLSPERKRRK